MTYYTVNQNGRIALVEWLEGVLAEPDYAQQFARALINDYDGSSVGADQIVEVRGFYTATGNPATYHFDKVTELDLNVDDGQFLDATGTAHDYDAAVELMDDDIREEMHMSGEFDTPQKFIEEYARRHREAFNEDFAPYTGGNW